MRRTLLAAAAVTALLAAGVGVVVARHNAGEHRASRHPSPSTTATPTATTTGSASPTTTSPTPTPNGTGPFVDEYDVVYAAGVSMLDGHRAVADAGGQVIHENAAAGV